MRVLFRVASASITLLLLAGCGSSTVAPPDEEGAGGDTGAGGSTQTGGAGGTTKTDGGKAGAAGKAGGSGAGGTSGAGGSSGGNGSITVPMPAPGTADKPAPSGSAANLKVLPWAGFKAAISYSFDDTQPSQIAHYPELQATGIHVTFYTQSNATWETDYDKTWSQAVKDGHEMGNHTVNHCNVADITKGTCGGGNTADEEVDQCNDYIVQHFGQTAVWTMAYPFGDGSWKTYAQKRFLMGRGIGGGTVGPTDNVDLYNLPILPVNGGESTATLNTPIDTARTAGKWGIFLFHSILPTNDNWYAGCDIASITGSIDHAKQAGDIWLDSVINVGAYLVAQQMLAKVTPTGTADKTYAWTLPAHFPPGHGVRVTVDGGTLKQGGAALSWDAHGYYEVALDAGSLTWSP